MYVCMHMQYTLHPIISSSHPPLPDHTHHFLLISTTSYSHPPLPARTHHFLCPPTPTLSPDAVQAVEASLLRSAANTCPLCPSNWSLNRQCLMSHTIACTQGEEADHNRKLTDSNTTTGSSQTATPQQEAHRQQHHNRKLTDSNTTTGSSQTTTPQQEAHRQQHHNRKLTDSDNDDNTKTQQQAH